MVQAGNLETEEGEVGYGGWEMSPMCGKGRNAVYCWNAPQNIGQTRGFPEQHMAKHERSNSTQEATHLLKGHKTGIFKYAFV